MNSTSHSQTWKLIGKTPVKCQLEEVSLDDKRQIALDKFGEVIVSTVFLNWDHSFGDSQGPVLFETLVFGGEFDGYMKRYTTYDQSLEGHNELCYLVNKKQIDRDRKIGELEI